MRITSKSQTSHFGYDHKGVFGQKRPVTYKSYKQMLLISGMYYLSFVYFGYIMMYFNSISFPHIMNVFHITLSKDTAQGIYSGLPALGACLGSFIAKYFIEKFSRNQNFILCNTLAIFAGILVLIPNGSTLFIGRLLQGVCVGFFCSITPLTVKQLSPIELAGTMNGVNNVAISLGYFIGYFLGWLSTTLFTSSQYNYLLVFSATFIISITQIIWVKIIFPYETPKYLLKNGRMAEAKEVIQKIYKLEYQDKILEEKMMQCSLTKKQQQQTVVQTEISSQPMLPKVQQSQVSKGYLLASFSATFLIIAQQMTGFNVFLLYGSQIAKQYLPHLAISLSMIISLEKLVVTLIASFFLFNHFGRKILLVAGSALCALALYCVVAGEVGIRDQGKGAEVYIFFGIFVCIFSVAATQGPLTWVYVAEVLQPKAIPFVVFMKWFTNFLSVATFPILRSWSQDQSCVTIFLSYFIFTLIATIIFHFTLVETKDKNQVEIYQQLQKKQDRIEKFICKFNWFRRNQ